MFVLADAGEICLFWPVAVLLLSKALRRSELEAGDGKIVVLPLNELVWLPYLEVVHASRASSSESFAWCKSCASCCSSSTIKEMDAERGGAPFRLIYMTWIGIVINGSSSPTAPSSSAARAHDLPQNLFSKHLGWLRWCFRFNGFRRDFPMLPPLTSVGGPRSLACFWQCRGHGWWQKHRRQGHNSPSDPIAFMLFILGSGCNL